ncbi:MAG TPA: amidohydrolase, partial [Acidimicrobiales bacterium]
MKRYLVISADTHAGLPGPDYREWLDPEYREPFDAFLVERGRAAEMAKAGFLNEEFAKAWHEENEEGLRGGWDAARRDEELDADGVAGEVIFPDADSVSGGASAPFGAGLGASGSTPGELLFAGARAHNR